MSNEKQETIEDIVADIRAQNQGLPEDSYALSPLVCDLLSFADRIEAAAKRFYDKYKEHTDELNRQILVLKHEKEMSDTYFCGYDPEEALVAQCSTCRFFKKKFSHCTLNDSLTNARYKCSGWKFKTNKECADEYKASRNSEIAELRECLREAVTKVCNRLEKCGFKEPCIFKTCYVQKWRKALREEGGGDGFKRD